MRHQMAEYNPGQYTHISQIHRALRKLSLESSELIVAIDFTSSNDSGGKHCFHGLSLHDLTDRGGPLNPYEQVVKTVSNSLADLDDDNKIPVYGFGDSRTEDHQVFSLFEDDQPADGWRALLARYRAVVPRVKKAGPTCFAPIIEQAMYIVTKSEFRYHVLLIIADGQVTRPCDTPDNALSEWEQRTVRALEDACQYPLSIIMVGVGDGPWETMHTFDNHLRGAFDNFHFINFTELQQQLQGYPADEQERRFALEALRELPRQFKYMVDNNMLGPDRANPPERRHVPYPVAPPVIEADQPEVVTRMYTIPEAKAAEANMRLQTAGTHSPGQHMLNGGLQVNGGQQQQIPHVGYQPQERCGQRPQRDKPGVEHWSAHERDAGEQSILNGSAWLPNEPHQAAAHGTVVNEDPTAPDGLIRVGRPARMDTGYCGSDQLSVAVSPFECCPPTDRPDGPSRAASHLARTQQPGQQLTCNPDSVCLNSSYERAPESHSWPQMPEPTGTLAPLQHPHRRSTFGF